MTDIELLWLKTISEDPKMIAYRPRLRAIAGSITATILLQQIIYRWVHNDFKPFYKYKEPCTADDYREGDSWCEELGFSRDEFDTALRHIAQKVSRNVERDPSKLVYYWTMPNRKTWYEINYTALCNVAIPIYVSGKSHATQPDKPTLPILYTKNTTKNTTKKKGESLDPPIGNSPAQTTSPPPPAPLATPLIDRAVAVAEAESFDLPKPSKQSVSVKPAKPKTDLPDSPHYTGREFINGRIPEGEGKNAIQVYYERHSIRNDKTRLSAPLEEDLRHITDLDRWRDVVKAWHQAGNKPTNIGGMIDWYNDATRLPSNRHKPTTYANGAAKPASADLTFKQWLLKTYYTDVAATVIYQTKKTEKELRNEYEQWITGVGRTANANHPGQPGQ